MNNTSNPFDDTVGSTINDSYMRLKHGGHYLFILVWEFFLGPYRPKKPKSKDSQFKFIAERLISTLPENPDQLTVKTTKQLLD